MLSPGDAAFGINIVTDERCRSGGLGCFQDVCRFCKLRDTSNSKHFLPCDEIPAPASSAPQLAPIPAPASIVPAAPQAVATPAPAVTPAPSITTPAPQPSPGRCSNIFSPELVAVGATAFVDPTCRGTVAPGCTNIVCRMCKTTNHPQLAGLQLCSAFANAPRQNPTPITPQTSFEQPLTTPASVRATVEPSTSEPQASSEPTPSPATI
ncbi:hypothetical protein PybrP1_009496, partial [[Pythium] brassicae (nom. inval.)]